MAENIIPFDDRDGVIWYNGKLVPWRDAKIHVLNHGLHYASCVFEGERCYVGTIFKSKAHSQRLHHSASILGFTIPYDVGALDKAKALVVKKMGLTDGYVRTFAWRGSEKMAVSSQNTTIHTAIAAWEWPMYFSKELHEKGIRLDWAAWRRPAPDTAPTQAKASGLYMICTMSKHKVEKEGFHDAMMLDYRGYIAEATGANFFMVIDGALHTPTPDCFLNGITRLTVIDLAKKLGIPVHERHIKPEELGQAKEAFLTGSAAEITPIGQIGAYHFAPGHITASLKQAFNTLVQGK